MIKKRDHVLALRDSALKTRVESVSRKEGEDWGLSREAGIGSIMVHEGLKPRGTTTGIWRGGSGQVVSRGSNRYFLSAKEAPTVDLTQHGRRRCSAGAAGREYLVARCQRSRYPRWPLSAANPWCPLASLPYVPFLTPYMIGRSLDIFPVRMSCLLGFDVAVPCCWASVNWTLT